ncbi:hypothetical protein [Clostridium isatidis]|uniref:hypothetical protein n=1 Tax=Clostridium isatidis TaxID=182773 RepID=UPI003AB0BDCF
MKKKKLLLILFICSLAGLIINNYIIRSILLIGISIIIFYIIGKKKYTSHINNRIPNIMENLVRNYDNIILGNESKIYENKINKNEKNLYLTNYSRNLYTDILILKRWYSFLRKEGIVHFNIDCKNRKYLFSEKISIFDDEFLHQVTLMEHGKDISSKKYKIIKESKNILFVFQNNFRTKSKKYDNLTSEDVQKLIFKIKSIDSFCKVRNIQLKIYFYNCNDILLENIKKEQYSNKTLIISKEYGVLMSGE